MSWFSSAPASNFAPRTKKVQHSSLTKFPRQKVPIWNCRLKKSTIFSIGCRAWAHVTRIHACQWLTDLAISAKSIADWSVMPPPLLAAYCVGQDSLRLDTGANVLSHAVLRLPATGRELLNAYPTAPNSTLQLPDTSSASGQQFIRTKEFIDRFWPHCQSKWFFHFVWLMPADCLSSGR